MHVTSVCVVAGGGQWVDRFYCTGCGCIKTCVQQFSCEHATLSHTNAAQLTRNELDVVLFGQLMAFTPCSEQQQERNRAQYSTMKGKKFVGIPFCFFITLEISTLKLLKCIYIQKGLFHVFTAISAVLLQML